MSTSSVLAARQKLTAHVASADTATLATALLRLDAMAATDATRRAGASVVEAICQRHPEVLDALEAWSSDLDSELSLVEVVVAALPLESLR